MTTVTPLPSRGGKVLEPEGHFTQVWSGWLRNVYNVLAPGQTVTVPIAKLTPGGTAGSLTFKNGILTGSVAPT